MGRPKDIIPRMFCPVADRSWFWRAGFLRSSLEARSTIPYTDIRNYLTRKMDDLAIELSYGLEGRGLTAVPVNAIGPCEWNADTGKSMGIISLKHAAVRAGLGRMGKNTLLLNDRMGNMVWLSAVLTTRELEADPMIPGVPCPPDCRICLDVCPVQALDGLSIDQAKCWNFAFGEHNGGEWRIKCFECRSRCPLGRGSDEG